MNFVSGIYHRMLNMRLSLGTKMGQKSTDIFYINQNYQKWIDFIIWVTKSIILTYTFWCNYTKYFHISNQIIDFGGTSELKIA